MRRIVPPALLAASVAGFVLSGLHSGAQGLQRTPASEGKSSTSPAYANGKVYITIRPATTP